MYWRSRSLPVGCILRRRIVELCSLCVVAAIALGCAQVTRRPDIVIGAANPADIDYPLGGAICRLLNLDTPRHGLRCAERLSQGTAATIEALRDGRFDIGIVPSDVLAATMDGQGSYAAWDSVTEPRVLFVGHADVLTVVTHRGSGIQTVEDLRGKRINIGSPGSRQRLSMERVMAALDLERKDFAEVHELSPAAQNRAFCVNKLDAIVYSVGHPNGLIRDATLTCDGVLIDVSGPAIDRMLTEYGEYESAVIPGGTYLANPAEVQTFGARAVVVATTLMSDAVAYEIARAVFDNFEDFRRLHPAFQGLTVEEMVRMTGDSPVHPGAARYYREHGWQP